MSAVDFSLSVRIRQRCGGRQLRYCAGCGERIGVYEPLRLEQPGGRLISTSLLKLDEDSEDGRELQLFHDECRADDLSAPPG